VREGMSDEALFFELALQDLSRAADLFLPVYNRTAGVDGFVSLEVSPLLAYDTQATIAEAKRLSAKAGKPNLFIKIPGTREGLPAIEAATLAGVPINVTLLFSTADYLAAAEAYMRGLEKRVEAGLDPDVRSVASVFISRWDAAVYDAAPQELRNTLGLAVGKRTYAAYRKLLESEAWLELANEGARPQRLLYASTGTKDPEAPDVLYIEGLASPQTINTMPEKALLAFAEHGEVGEPIPADGGDAEATFAAFAEAGIDTDAVAAKLQTDGADSFVASWRALLETIAEQRKAVA